MTRHNSYREGAWAVWPKDRTPDGGLCYDTPEELLADKVFGPNAGDRYRLVRLHRVSIEDVLHEAGNYSWLSTEVVAAMTKLGVALTERWVAAEEREIEPALREDGCRCDRCGRIYRVDVLVRDTLWKEITAADKASMLCGPCILARLEERGLFGAYRLVPVDEAPPTPADPLLSRLLAAWSTLAECHRKFVVDYIGTAERSDAQYFPRPAPLAPSTPTADELRNLRRHDDDFAHEAGA